MLTSIDYDVCRYARYGDVSPKVDVYAFGVVLYELISAKEAIVRSTECASDVKGLVYLVIVLLNQLFLHSASRIFFGCHSHFINARGPGQFIQERKMLSALVLHYHEGSCYLLV